MHDLCPPHVSTVPVDQRAAKRSKTEADDTARPAIGKHGHNSAESTHRGTIPTIYQPEHDGDLDTLIDLLAHIVVRVATEQTAIVQSEAMTQVDTGGAA